MSSRCNLPAGLEAVPWVGRERSATAALAAVLFLTVSGELSADSCCGSGTVEVHQQAVSPGDLLFVTVRWRGDPDSYGSCKGVGVSLLTQLFPEEVVARYFRANVGEGTCSASCSDPVVFAVRIPESLDPEVHATVWVRGGLVYPCGAPTCGEGWCWYCADTEQVQIMSPTDPPSAAGSDVGASGTFEELCVRDCNDNGVPDIDEICEDPGRDCNDDGELDACQSLTDVNGNGLPDACEFGACCDGAGGACADGVVEGACTGRWIAGATCEEQPFVPPCGPFACCVPEAPVNPVEVDCLNLSVEDCEAVGGLWRPGAFCGPNEHTCDLWPCVVGEGDCTLPQPAFCEGGERDGQPCEVLSVPGECPGGTCVGRVGCHDACCCTSVCLQRDDYCCTIHWDEQCATTALSVCRLSAANDECFALDGEAGAYTLDVPDTVVAGVLRATRDEGDPALCCLTGGSPSSAVGSVWYKFAAPTPSDPDATLSSVRLDTCCSPTTAEAPADDSLIQVFGIADPDRGVCADGSPCSISAGDCVDGSACSFDEAQACESLEPLACNDNAGTACRCGQTDVQPNNSELCVAGLVPGATYYVMVAAKSESNRGLYRLRLTTPCTPAAPAVPGDMDGSGSVDLQDHFAFAACVNGPFGSAQRPQPWYPGPCCGPGDGDADRDIDLVDVATFQQLFGTPSGR